MIDTPSIAEDKEQIEVMTVTPYLKCATISYV